jgi:heavy metal sensor kinase
VTDSLSERIREHTLVFPIKEYVEVWSSGGKLLHRSRNLADDTLAIYATVQPGVRQSIETVTRFRNHDVRLITIRGNSAHVFLAMPLENVLQPVRQLSNVFLWLGPAVLLIAIGVGMWLAKTSFSEVNNIIATAQNITAERLHDRIPEGKTQDEIGRLITTFNEMISRLDVSFNQMRHFSADASHELRTPLAVMRTQLESALNSEATMGDLKRIAANCLDETLRMGSIAEDLLFLSRADAGQEVVKRERVRLDQLVKATYDESVIIASHRSIAVELQPVDEVTILGEESRLRRMLLNLIDNAVKYNHEHGTIGISLSKMNGSARIIITDSGIGIPAEDVARIFDRFYRVDRARSREMGGSGLGLSIVYWIVHAHGGSISVKSDLKKGSEFSVTFPLAPAQE